MEKLESNKKENNKIDKIIQCSNIETNQNEKNKRKFFQIKFEFDLISWLLFTFALLTRMFKLEEPRNIVFDELHYGKYVSLYMKNTFFFDSNPPLGKQLIAIVAYLANFDGNYKFDKIGSLYPNSVPVWALRFIPALCSTLTIPLTYHLLLELRLNQWISILGALLLLFDNALLTQSRFILMESILIFFVLLGILCIIKFRNSHLYSIYWFIWLICSAVFLTCAICVKYIGFYSYCLGLSIILYDFWQLLPNLSNKKFSIRFLTTISVFFMTTFLVYTSVFYVHFQILYKAGPHDSIMTSAFQASLDGGLASITKGQPLLVAHGSQITLRHTHGRTCWLHSHNVVYPIRYPDKRGSSHQQQVTCYCFKDVNNWWIVKRPNKNDLVVEQPIDVIKNGDVIQLVHGITSRALNSHDVAAPISPQCQEVSCYIDYNVSMSAQNLWRVEILNNNQDNYWHTIQSLVRLIHVDTNTALKFSGRQLPDWGYHQHEIVADKIVNQKDTIWNVEEHRYTKSDDQKERERQLITAEMIPITPTKLGFWEKFSELHYKMLFNTNENVILNHMYSSEPMEWPLMDRGIAYWISSTSNAQIHLLGNLLIWISSTLGLVMYFNLFIYYLLRQRRGLFDLNQQQWLQFKFIGHLFFCGYLIHYLPYFFVERTLFLHHYLPAFTFKVLLLTFILQHLYYNFNKLFANLFIIFIICWLLLVVYVFYKFTVFSYGIYELDTNDIINLRWKDTWDFIVHKN